MGLRICELARRGLSNVAASKVAAVKGRGKSFMVVQGWRVMSIKAAL
jgi:hypothetical protein